MDNLEYLEETKELIRQKLNELFLLDIGENDTFRSYVTKLNNLAEDYPTT